MHRRARRRRDIAVEGDPKPAQARDQACRYCDSTSRQTPLGAAYPNGNVPMRCGWCMRNYVAMAAR